MSRDKTDVLDEIHESQRKLTAAKKHRDQGTINYLRIRIAQLQKEAAEAQ